jgi:hypothetical protein
MKTFLLLQFLTLTVPLLAGENLADGVQYPRIVGEWTDAGDLAMACPPVAQLSPGHFYMTAAAKDPKVTAIYHTTDNSTFKVDDPKVNVKAMNLVTEFATEGGMIVKQGEQWYLLGKRDGTAVPQRAKLEWQELAPISPRQPDPKNLRVALFDDYGSFGKGVPRCTELLQKAEGVKVTLVKPSLIREGGLKDFDVVIFTGGSGGKQAGTLGLIGREQVRRFVEAGGGYVGICAGNYLACDGFSWGVHVLDAKTKSSKWARGVGDVKIEFTPKGREILGMPEGILDIRYANGPVFDPGGDDAIADFEPLAHFRSELAKNGAPVGAQVNSPAMVAGSYGKGRVLCSSPHPEQQAGMEAFVERAVRWVAGQ